MGHQANRTSSPALAAPSGNPKFELFDPLRAFAVSAVVLFHVVLVSGSYSRPLIGETAFALGALGPTLFFSISGFLLWRPYCLSRTESGTATRVGAYAKRRALRILPAYWFALTALAIFPGIVGVFSGDWWRFYLFAQVYDSRTVLQGIPVAWTLCAEVVFYAFLPLFFSVDCYFKTRNHRFPAVQTLCVLTLASFVLQVMALRLAVPPLLAATFLGQFAYFAIGMLLAEMSVRRQPSRRPWDQRAPFLLVLLFALAFGSLIGLAFLTGNQLGLSEPLEWPFAVGRPAITALCCATLVGAASLAPRPSGRVWRLPLSRPVVYVGVISYGIYLWHLTVAEFVALTSAPEKFRATGLGLSADQLLGRTLTLLLITLAVSVAIASASYRLIELPFLRRKAGVKP